MNSRNIPDKAVKTLFALSGNRCAFPGCNQVLVEADAASSRQTVIGQIAHIVAHGNEGPRSDSQCPGGSLNSHENLVLLCPTCHARIDKLPRQYTTQVLLQMKRDHETKFMSANPVLMSRDVSTKDDIFASVLPVTGLPMAVYSAETDYRKQNVGELWNHILHVGGQGENLPFDLRKQRLYAFHNLAAKDSPFREVCNPIATVRHDAREMWQDPDDCKAYTYLINRALRNHLSGKGVRFHPGHQRFYFLPSRDKVTRVLSYKTLTGRREKRNVVWNPITRATGRGKRHWIHLAAGLRLQYVGSQQWVLTIRPERYLTKDGFVEYDSDKIGRKVTRLKATMHNRGYLAEVHFWAGFISANGPRLALALGKQWLTVENRLLECSIEWPGIPGDDQAFTERQPEEDLFSFAEFSRLTEELEESEGGNEDEDQ